MNQIPVTVASAALVAVTLLGPATSLEGQDWRSVPPLRVSDVAELALGKHPVTARASEELARAEADRRIAGSSRFPSLSLAGSTSRFQEPMIVAPLHAFDPTRPPTFEELLIQGSVQAAYTLFDGGARDAAIRAAEEGLAGARASAAGAEAEVLAGVITAYVGVQVARAGSDAAVSRREALASERERADRVFREGAAPRVQVLRASAAFEEARAAEGAARARLRAAEQDLARLTGLDPAEIAGRELTVLASPASGSPEMSTGSDLRGSPGMEVARRRLEAARANESVARAALFPTVRGTIGFQEFGSGAGEFVGEWQAGLQVSYPIFVGGARTAGSDRARAMTRGAEAAVEALELDLLRLLDRAVAARIEAEGRRDALLAAVAQYEEVARIEALSVDEGAGVQRDLLAAQAELFRARSALAEAEGALTSSTVEIARLRGALDIEWIDQNLESSS